MDLIQKILSLRENASMYKGLFINDVIVFSMYPLFSLQTTHVLRVQNTLSIHGWSELKPAENDDVIF